MAEEIDNSESMESLEFESEKGSARSFWVALILVLALVAWMGSGFIFPAEEEEEVAEKAELLPVAVAVSSSTAKPVTQFFQAEGQALPDRDTAIRSETST